MCAFRNPIFLQRLAFTLLRQSRDPLEGGKLSLQCRDLTVLGLVNVFIILVNLIYLILKTGSSLERWRKATIHSAHYLYRAPSTKVPAEQM